MSFANGATTDMYTRHDRMETWREKLALAVQSYLPTILSIVAMVIVIAICFAQSL